MKGTRKRSIRAAGVLLSLLLLQSAAQPPVLTAFAEETSSGQSLAANQSAMVIDLQNVAADESSSAFTVAAFGNEYSELLRIASAGVYVNNRKLNYNSSYSSLYYVSSGDCIVTGKTIQFHSNLLSEGENTLTFKNPDKGEDSVVRVRMTKVEVPPKYWYESTSYDYVVELLQDAPAAYTVTWKNGDAILETDTEVPKDSEPSYDGSVPEKTADDQYVYAFAGWALEEGGEALAVLPAVTGDATYYAVFSAEEIPSDETRLFVRIVGSFEHKIVGQEEDVDAVSSATTGGSSYLTSGSSAHVEYALVSGNVSLENVPEDAWNTPDYFKNGDLLQVDGAASKIIISPECQGIYGEINPFSGDLFLRGVPETAGSFKVSVYLSTNQGDAVSNALDYRVYTGEEKLIDQLIYDNCVQTADGKYMYDSEPWYMQEFGGENETVVVPKDIKAWYGSHAVLPEVNYSEIGRIISLTEGEEPSQTLVIPSGCNLTMVNMIVHSGVRIIVQDGAKLTLRQTTVEGIVEVQGGGTFSMDYNDYGSGEWLHGSSINGQLQMKDGSVLENARITCHANYGGGDDENRRNFAPVVTTEGEVTISGDVYILGEEAPSGETGQAAIRVSGKMTVPEGSVLACYGGGTSMLTADGGSAIELDNGTIEGAGSVIAIGGYGMNITGDPDKGSGGAAVSGSGRIDVANAYLEGGASYHGETLPLEGAVVLSDTMNRCLVTGAGETTEKSEFYWFGTGDPNGIIPRVEDTLAQIPANAPAVASGKDSLRVTVDWTDGREHTETVTAWVKDADGEVVSTLRLTADNAWSAAASGLDREKTYAVEADDTDSGYTFFIEKMANVSGESWEKAAYGAIEENETYLISYEDSGKTYVLGAQDGVLGFSEWDGSLTPDAVPEGFKWVPVKSSGTYYGVWFLMNQEGEKNTYLSMRQNGLDVVPALYVKDSSTYYALFADDDGSLWNRYFSKNFLVENGVLSTSKSSFTSFTFYKKIASDAAAFTLHAVNFEKVEAKEPTFTEDGNIEYYLGSDGKYYLKYGEKYTEVTEDAVKLKGLSVNHSLTLDGGKIGVNFILDFGDLSREDITAKAGLEGKLEAAEFVEKTIGGENWVCVSYYVNAKEMTDEIVLELLDKGETCRTDAFSVRRYYDALKALTNAGGKTMDLMEALLTYGSMAQKYFDYRTDELADEGISSELPDIPEKMASARGTLPNGITLKGATLLLETDISCRINFGCKGKLSDYTFKVDGVTVEPKEASGRYYIEKEHIQSYNIQKSSEFTISKGKRTWTLTYGPMIYASTVRKKYADNQNLFALVKAMYLYNQKARAYVEN